MNAVGWAKSIQLKNETNQKQMENAVEILYELKLNSLNDYTQEAFAKTFCDVIYDKEARLLREHEIHPNKLDLLKVSMNPHEYQRKYLTIEKIIETDIAQRLELFLTFLNDSEPSDIWNDYRLLNPKNQKHMEEVTESLYTLLKGRKNPGTLVGIFCESIYEKELNLLHSNGVHPNSSAKNRPTNQTEHSKKIEEVEKQIEVAIKRQLRLITRML